MKKTFTIIFIIFIGFTTITAQNINGRFSSSLYMFERFDTADVSNTYLRSFQMLSLNINKDNFSVRSYLNLENDLSKKLTDDPRLRFYNLYFEARNLFDMVTLKLGRQPLFSKVAGGLFDGVNLDFKYGGYKLSGFYGGNVPAYQKLEVTNDWENDFIAGGKFTTTAIRDFQISLSYINKNFKSQDYWATRLDTDLNPIQVLIRNNSNQYRFASTEVRYEMEKTFSIDTRFDFDFNFWKASKFEIYGSYDQLEKVHFNVYYNYREPFVRYNSIFSVFDYGNTQEFEIGGGYSFNKNLTLLGKFGYVNYKDDNSQRFTLGLTSGYGSLTYRKSLGYAGELDALSLYAAHSFLEGLLTPSIGVSYTGYKLSADSEKNTLATVLAGLNVRPLRILSVDLQGHYMNNKIYKNDYRFFLKLNYWFNTNLNLM